MAKQYTNLHLIAVVIISLLAGLVGGYAGSELQEELEDTGASQLSQTVITEESQQIASIAAESGASVVSIVSTLETSSFFGSFEEEGSGTGIILSEDGVIMTNRHVVPDGTISMTVTTADGTVYENVELIGRDPRSGVDLAFIKVSNPVNFKPATIGDSDSVEVGQQVVAIGNALGEFENTVTTGIISGVSRPIIAGDGLSGESLTNLLQTDAAINPGNSGGPLLDLKGEVIGINTAVARGENIGFAIAISDVKGVIEGVLQTGVLRVPYLGVRYQILNERIIELEGLNVENGAIIRGGQNFPAVVEGSPADKSGLQDGDIILEINNQEISEDNQLSVLIGRQLVGDSIELLILRDGEEQRLSVVLEAAPESF